MHPEDRDRALRGLTEHLERRAPYDVEYRLRTDSGEYRWFSDSGHAIWDEKGKPVRMSGSLKDVTEAKEGTGSVDLREALATIEDFRQRLLEGRTARQGADDDVFVTRSTSAGRRLAKLIEDLQTLARAMDSQLRREPVDLSAVARSIVRMLHKTPGKRDIEFSIAKGLVAEGDARLLRAMMENLLGNAYRSTAKRQGARVRFGAEEQDGKTVYHVRDNGAGFDMAHADRLFRLFQRLHPRDEFEGTGVGLAIVRHIVTRHGGSVWAEGEVGHGATFYFTL